MILLSEFIS